MKKVLLQNHPGSEKYSFNGWEIFNSNFERMIKENKAMLLCKWGFYLTCVTGSFKPSGLFPPALQK